MGPVLVVPATERGRGGGHVVRSCRLVRDLHALGEEAFIYLPAGKDEPLLKPAGGLDPAWIITERIMTRTDALPPPRFIVLDRFRTPPREFFAWKRIAPLIGIDEGGPCRARFDFLVDLLPGPPRFSPPNRVDPSLLPLPLRRRPSFGTHSSRGRFRLLVSFGAEDSAGLAAALGEALYPPPENVELTLVTSKPFPAKEGFVVRNTVPNLREELASFDMVITHFGLTAFEALYSRVPVVLVSPTAYHKKLARAAGFFVCDKKDRRLKDLLKDAFIRGLAVRCEELAKKFGLAGPPSQTLAAFVHGLEPLISPACPLCRSSPGKRPPAALHRLHDRTYYRCPRCGVISMNRLNPPPIEYAEEYFFDQYKRQYGKTYLEDFPKLRSMGKARLAVIKKLLPGAMSPTLLDIGCAYGPFLAAAADAGFSPLGLDPAEDAVRWINQELGLTAVQGFFPGASLPAEGPHSPPFDVISLWYVIEHFRDPYQVLKEIGRLLKPGGVLAFSTPSYSGISGRTSLKKFLKASPADHWTIWSPRICRKLLKKSGFTVKKILISGHHPERFPLAASFCRKQGLCFRLLFLISRIFGLGDTFELYAVKTF